ncbi:hypothetical protein FG05_35437 [Fusarium graminearum]|nr:hypothetical protein FG05_35437 [Fusarium graminearum]
MPWPPTVSSMDCDPEKLKKLVNDKEVGFDADIAGLGVLIAFVTTSVATIIVLVFAFLTDSVPSHLLNTGDAIIASGIRRLCHRPLGGSSTPNHAKEVDIRNERIASYKAFLHSANDQLLVSLVAIMIGAVITSSKITIYLSNLVIAIGCLSLTVHLGCFPFYMDRLIDHRVAMTLRVLPMLSGVVMLLFMLILRLSDTWDMKTHVYLKCAIKGYILDSGILSYRLPSVIIYFAVFYGACEIVWVSYKQQSPDTESGGRPPQDQQGTSLATEIIHRNRHNPDIELQQTLQVPSRLLEYRGGNSSLNLSTIEREVLAVYEIMERSLTDDTGRSANIQNNFNQTTVTLFKPNTEPMRFMEIWKNVRAEQQNTLLNRFFRVVALDFLLYGPKPGPRLRYMMRWHVSTWIFHQCLGSFVWRLCWLWSGVVYGVSSIVLYHGDRVGMKKISDHWGFGQIVAVTLLVLPLFAAMESRADYKRRTKSIIASYEISTEPTDGRSINSSLDHHTPGHGSVQGAGCQADIEAIQFAGELFRRRAAAIGYPFLHTSASFVFAFIFGVFIICRFVGLARMAKVNRSRCLPGFLENLDGDISEQFS